MRIVDNAAYSLAAAGMRRKERYEKASEWLSRFGLNGFEKRWPDSLSGGEAQRVSLVRTLIAEPSLVLFDEPFSALDAPLRKKLSEELRQWQKELGFAGIVVTHDIEEARALGDEITVMKAGKQVWSGLPVDFEESLLV
jgi:ABC-type nitrate/sulfonate/bicarbonate transport system ATPase subunit